MERDGERPNANAPRATGFESGRAYTERCQGPRGGGEAGRGVFEFDRSDRSFNLLDKGCRPVLYALLALLARPAGGVSVPSYKCHIVTEAAPHRWLG